MIGYKLNSLKMTSGVPQGSHLGPIFFNIFVNDIPAIISNSIPFLFTDNLKILEEINSTADSKALQTDINFT